LLAVGVVFRADDGLKFVEESGDSERTNDRAAAPARNNGKRNAVVMCSTTSGIVFKSESLSKYMPSLRMPSLNRHGEAVHCVQRGDDFIHRLAAPGVK
jgi:hypothetical protein